MPFSQPHVVPSPRLWISDLHDMGALNPPGGSEWIASFASPRGGHTRSVQRSKRKSTWCFPPPAGKRALIVQDINTAAGKRLTVLAMAVSRGSIIGCNVPIASPQVRPKERGISTSRVGSTASGAGTLPDPAEPRQRARIDHGHWRIEPVVVVSFEFTLPILAQPSDTTCPSRLSMTQFLAARRIGRDNALHQARPVGFSSLLFFLVTFTSKRPRPWSVDFVDPESCVRWWG